ncbi:MAG: hypothetical protein IJQ16_06725 [Selenomonadaceae bacterium]|nr:hypothetical protein [Selenomonadaceae bacterium]
MSDYVYNYYEGDSVLIVDESDSVSLDSDTAIHVRGIQQVNDSTKIVFDNYTSLNIFGRVGSLIVDGETVISNTPIPSSSSESVDITSYDSEIYAATGDTIDLGDLGITANRIRGIQRFNYPRTAVVYDTYRSLNIYGYPGEIDLNGTALITNDTSSIDWGSSDEGGTSFIYDSNYLVLNETSTIDLSSVDWDDILGVKVDDDSAMFVFSDFSGVQVFGKAGSAVIGDDLYSIDYNNGTITKVETSESSSSSEATY